VNVLVKDTWRQSKKWTLADAELENLPLPNLSQPSSILSPAHLREVVAQLSHALQLWFSKHNIRFYLFVSCCLCSTINYNILAVIVRSYILCSWEFGEWQCWFIAEREEKTTHCVLKRWRTLQSSVSSAVAMIFDIWNPDALSACIISHLTFIMFLHYLRIQEHAVFLSQRVWLWNENKK